MKGIVLFLLLLLSITRCTQAQDLFLSLNDGQTEAYQFEDIRRMTFMGSALNLELANGATIQWNLDDVKSLRYDEQSTELAVLSSMNNLDFRLRPNPMTELVEISYHLSEASHVRLSIFDSDGKAMFVLFDEFQQAGPHLVSQSFNENLSTGVYFCCFESENFVLTKKILVDE